MSQELDTPESSPSGEPRLQSRHPENRAREASYFDVLGIDAAPALLEQSYALRYEVYCLERGFLPPDDYPDRLETDEFDEHSLHFGALDTTGHLAGTARIVRPSVKGLPLFEYCKVFFDEAELHRPEDNIVEISRMVVSRKFRRRREDSPEAPEPPGPRTGPRERRRGKEMIVCLIDALYQACTLMGVTHALAGMEYNQQRLLSSYGFPFHPIGPDLDYFGRVAPFMLDLRGFRPGQHMTPSL